MKLCKLTDCDDQHHALGYCLKHYKRFVRWGSPRYKAQAANGEHGACETCALLGHYRPSKARKNCDAHYGRLRRTGGLVNRYGMLVIGTVECK